MNRIVIVFVSFAFFTSWTIKAYADENLDSIEALIQAGEFKQAEQVLKKTTKNEPSNIKAWVLLGDAYVGREKEKKAVEAYQKAIHLDPKNEDAHLGLGAAYNMMKSYSMAIEAYKQIIGLNPKHAEAHYQLGLTYDRAVMLTQAFEEYNILKTLDEDLAAKLYHVILGK
ncbi:MAG: tetratricopeptide repeat protein [Deltaproteobacteria bacterium]|nr:tetratricopeptide repeat protein [Deltaproteobacteria bacterium]